MGLIRWVKSLFVKNKLNKTISYDEFTKGIIRGEEDNVPQNLSGVYACIEIISNTISKLPFFVMDRKSKKHIENDNLYWLLNYQPNEYMNAFTFKKYIARSILCTGNGYVYPIRKRNSLEIEQLIPVQSDAVTPVKNGNKVLYGIHLNDKDFVLRYDELIHIKAYTDSDGITGISPLAYAKNTIAVGLNQEKFQKDFYRKGGRPSGTLETPEDVTLKTKKVTLPDGTEKEISYRKIIIDAFEEGRGADGEFFRTALLDNGVKYTPITQISPADMDFVNSKTVNLEDIARFFNVPAYKLGVGKQTYSNNEQAQIDYITNCIVPFATQWEQEFTLKLLPYAYQEKGQVIKSNIEAELRGDTAARANWYDKMRSMGVYSINEIRAYENLPEIENGDARLIGANSVPLERLINGESAATVTPNDLTETVKEEDDKQNGNADNGENKPDTDNNETA